MAVEKYQGKYVNAQDASNVIDMVSILDGCRMLKEASGQLSTLAKKINQVKDYYNRDTLSINSKDMEDYVDYHEKNTKDFSLYLTDLAETLTNTTQRVYNRKQMQFNDEARLLDEQQALLYQKPVFVEDGGVLDVTE